MDLLLFFSSGVTFGDFRLCYYNPLPYLIFTVLCVFVSTFPGLLTLCLSHPSIYPHTSDLMDERIDVIWTTLLRVSFSSSFSSSFSCII
ncbi:uncharacterized protein BO88DRAFT_62394 [Aspergillus vadensis CBS 113365]|uniref:Uncharacterized protein n=1 Tax=Aspergillus vadensis (strain CBS 113365 / IMI 142717 / IBT 24658) TaxID=1448311 RepID=A0A319B9P9_ASPVC|nr:hypothetical protein BO88DRAFT_62394 [Aspergillus vadensis CBS 113365]PYH68641.1 hypothetical protein BO88DRAFT_62394 [Aspergillus vadensis CBS 113365]